MPKAMWPARRAGEWTSAVERALAAQRGASMGAALVRFVGAVRRISPYYGVTFFGSARLTSGALKRHKGSVVIGVGADGVTLVRPKDRELVAAFTYPEISSWSSSTAVFAFEAGTLLETHKLAFETPQVSIVHVFHIASSCSLARLAGNKHCAAVAVLCRRV